MISRFNCRYFPMKFRVRRLQSGHRVVGGHDPQRSAPLIVELGEFAFVIDGDLPAVVDSRAAGRFADCAGYEWRPVVVVHRVSDDFLGTAVDDGREIQPALSRRYVLSRN